MNIYRNRNTGVVIEVPSQITGDVWELVNPKPTPTKVVEKKSEEVTKPKKVVKKTNR